MIENDLDEIRPWGSYSLLEDNDSYKIKHVSVNPGERLSLQMHYHRSEHWIIAHGTAEIELDGHIIFLTKGESTFVKSGVKHRLGNPGKIVLDVIEVEIGEYLKEDDIIRFE